MKSKLFKKILGLVLSLSMLGSCMLNVSAADEAPYVGIEGSTMTSWPDFAYAGGTSLVSISDSHSGLASMYVNGTVQLYQNRVVMESKYYSGMWVRGAGDDFTASVTFNWNYAADYKYVKTDGNWSYYEAETPDLPWFGEQGCEIRVSIKTSAPVLVDDIDMRQYQNGAFTGRQDFVNSNMESYTGVTFPQDKFSGIKGSAPTDWTIADGAALISTDYAHTGKTSLYAEKGQIILYQKATVHCNTHTIGMWAKCDPSDFSAQFLVGWNSSGQFEPKKMENGWVYYEATLTVTDWYGNTWEGAGAEVRVVINSNKPFLIDDLTRVGPDSDDQFIINSSFESYGVQLDVDYIESANIQSWISDSGNAYITTAEKHSGNAALYIPKSAVLLQKFTTLEGTATMGMWVKGSATGLQLGATANYQNGVNYQAVKTEGDWTYYECQLQTGWYGDNAGEIRIYITAPYGVIIDDVTMTWNNGYQFLQNSDFESYTVIDTRKTPINLTAYPAASGNTAVISWKNPNYNISDIKVMQDGVQLTDITVDKTAEARNQVVVSGLENYREYKFDVIPVISDTEYPESVTVVPNGDGASHYAGNHAIGKWTSSRNDAATDNVMHYANVNTDLDYKEKVSGNASYKISGYMDDVYPNVWSKLSQTVTLSRDKEYKLILNAKASGLNVITVNESFDDANVGSLYAKVLTVNDTWADNLPWKEYSGTLATENGQGEDIYDVDGGTYEATIEITVTKLIGTAWIDDVAIYEVDPDTAETVGENLLADSGFEFKAYRTSAELDGKLKAGDNAITAKVRNESAGDDFKACVSVALYKDGKLVNVQSLSKAVAESKWYEPGEAYTFTVNVPSEETDKYTASVFFWNSITEMRPLGEATVFATK